MNQLQDNDILDEYVETNEDILDESAEESIESLEKAIEFYRKRREELQNKRLARKRRRVIGTVACIASLMILICIGVTAYVFFGPDDNDKLVQNPPNSDTVNTEGSNGQEQESSTEKDKPDTPLVKPSEEPKDAPEEQPETQKSSGFARYSMLSYSDEELVDRYDAYSAANPSFPVDEVVWRVNANLDKPKYEYDVPASDSSDPYIIVNKYYTVPEGFRPPDLESFDGYLMRHDTGVAYTQMRKAAAAEGFSIRAVSAFRTVDYQRGLYNSYLQNDAKENVDRYSARPGHSEHHTGMAIDLFGSVDGLRAFESTPEYPWVRDNCYKYGFIIRYTKTGEDITGYEFEPWHIRYVGTEISNDMKNKNIETYEEYYAKYLYKSRK